MFAMVGRFSCNGNLQNIAAYGKNFHNTYSTFLTPPPFFFLLNTKKIAEVQKYIVVFV